MSIDELESINKQKIRRLFYVNLSPQKGKVSSTSVKRTLVRSLVWMRNLYARRLFFIYFLYAMCTINFSSGDAILRVKPSLSEMRNEDLSILHRHEREIEYLLPIYSR